MLSTYPPTACGLATFSSALARALEAQGHRTRIVRVTEHATEPVAVNRVAGTLVNGSGASVRRAAAMLSDADTAIVQHEYGIFGGRDGEEVLDVIRGVTVPVITVLHTVPLEPTPNQRRILEEISRWSSRVVVLTRCARDRLVGRYSVDDDAVETIPHGAIVVDDVDHDTSMGARDDTRPELLSWGLLGPNKGIEHVIDAVAALHAQGHSVRYTIAGMTHPKVVQVHGEAYRHGLVERARARGIGHLVSFDPTYRGPDDLARYLATSSVIVLPYASADQVVSGVLVDSIAAARPVISTAFPHAVELLSSGAGLLVRHDDSDGLEQAIRAATSDRRLLDTMADTARGLADQHRWSRVAARYADLSSRARAGRQAIPA